MFKEATVAGRDHVAVRSGDLHKRVGGYPGPDHRMPVACRAMMSVLDEAHGDRVLSQPPSGQGASLAIKFVLPRPKAFRAPVTGVADAVLAPPRLEGGTKKERSHVHPAFLAAVEALHAKFEKLSHMAPAKPGALPSDAPVQGVYLFSEGARPMYVGRTKNLKQRIGNHCGNGSRENQAVFAFKLAREATGKGKAAYTSEGSRAALMRDPVFAEAFREAKARVRRMDLRYVGEQDSLHQALLEMYIAVVLQTPYNDFDTH